MHNYSGLKCKTWSMNERRERCSVALAKVSGVLIVLQRQLFEKNLAGMVTTNRTSKKHMKSKAGQKRLKNVVDEEI